MNVIKFVDRKGRTFNWDEADGYGWFLEMSYNMLKNGFKDEMTKVKNFEMRDDDVLICAFPKAGTNWVWEMVSMVRRGKPEFERNFKLAAMLEMRTLESLNSLQSPRVLNTHVYPSCFPDDVLKKKIKIIHIMRHPKDIAVSFYYHFRQLNVCLETPPYESFSEFLPYVTGEYGVYMLVSIFRYLDEFETFMKGHPDMVLNLYFEELKRNPIETVRRIAKFLDTQLIPDVMKQITEKCSFDNMKEFESSNSKEHVPEVFAYFRETEMTKLKNQGGVVFFRKGEIGDWKTHFTVAESENFDRLLNERLKDNIFVKYYY